MAPKRRLFLAAGDNGGAPPGKRVRVAAAAGPPSPGRRLLRQTVFVVLFLIRAADRNAMDSISQIGRVVREEVRRCLDPIFRGYSLLVSKLEGIEERIQALTHKVDQITPSRPNHHNHQQLVHEPNQEGTIEEGLATNKGEDKSTIARLRFLDGMKTPIYHDDEIKADSNGAIKIGIFDGEEMIKSDKLSKVRVEIVALEGNFPYDVADSWTAKEFNEHRAVCRDGKGNVLAGKCTVQLINGVASLGSIKFREGSCRARNGMFIVGARVCDGVRTGGRVQEAIMNPVVVQDRRNKANEKSHPPKLDDGVHRLEEIAKDGTYRKRLEEARIFTVQGFLRALNKNPDNLTKVLKIKKEHKSWEKMVRHAQDCCLKGKHELISCQYTEGNVVLFFNCVHFLVGAVFDGHYTASDKFNPDQQAIVDKLKERAYDQLDVLPFDHVMKDNFPVPISTDTDTSAGPPYMSSAAQPNHPDRHTAHQVGGIAAVEGLNPNSNHNPSSSLPDHHNKRDYQDQGTRPADQEQQLSSASGADWCRNPFGQPDSPHQTTDGFYDVARAKDDEMTFLLDQADGIDQLDCSAPGPAQVSMQSQRQAPLPSNGPSVSEALGQAALSRGHEKPFADTDTSVSPWFQEQPLPGQNDAPPSSLNATADLPVFSRHSSFRPDNFHEMREHWEQEQIMPEDWLGDGVDTSFPTGSESSWPRL